MAKAPKEKVVDLNESLEGEIMTSIKIGDKEYPLHIGFGFLRTIERLYASKIDGNTGTSIGLLFVDLYNRNAFGILNFILAATSTEKMPPTEREIEEAYGDFDVEELCANFTKLLYQSALTRPQIQMYEKLGQEMMKQQMEQ